MTSSIKFQRFILCCINFTVNNFKYILNIICVILTILLSSLAFIQIYHNLHYYDFSCVPWCYKSVTTYYINKQSINRYNITVVLIHYLRYADMIFTTYFTSNYAPMNDNWLIIRSLENFNVKKTKHSIHIIKTISIIMCLSIMEVTE